MGIRENYYIEKITYREATEMVVKYHYLHRPASCVHAYGLFERNTGVLVGCVMYGIPASPRVSEGICGVDEAKNVYELTRLFIHDVTPKNAESYLIGNTINKLDRELIISYSEIAAGHIGTIYQATNFIYLGLTEKRTNRVKIDGSTTKHNRHECMNKDNTMLVDRPRKHRYLFINSKGKRKKELLAKIKYKEQIYPKGDIKKPEKNEVSLSELIIPMVQISMF